MFARGLKWRNVSQIPRSFHFFFARNFEKCRNFTVALCDETGKEERGWKSIARRKKTNDGRFSNDNNYCLQQKKNRARSTKRCVRLIHVSVISGAQTYALVLLLLLFCRVDLFERVLMEILPAQLESAAIAREFYPQISPPLYKATIIYNNDRRTRGELQ